ERYWLAQCPCVRSPEVVRMPTLGLGPPYLAPPAVVGATPGVVLAPRDPPAWVQSCEAACRGPCCSTEGTAGPTMRVVDAHACRLHGVEVATQGLKQSSRVLLAIRLHQAALRGRHVATDRAVSTARSRARAWKPEI